MTARDVREFQRLVATLDYPMYVVTTMADDDGELSGCLVGFVTQCSIDPPRHAVWISNKNHTCRVVARAHLVAVHPLHEGNRDLADLFGGETGDEVDKFSQCTWRSGPEGVPIVEGTAGWFVARIVERLPDTGDHLGHIIEPIAAEEPPRQRPPRLGFQSVKAIDPGHEP